MNSPRKTKLYNELAKDFLPKQAIMRVCQYIEGLEQRIVGLETQKPSAKAKETNAEKTKTPAKDAGEN